MFTENPMKGILKCDCCGFEQQVYNNINQPVRYNFHMVETSNLIQPMLETTKDKNFIKEALIRKLFLCDNCYKYVDETFKKLNDKK